MPVTKVRIAGSHGIFKLGKGIKSMSSKALKCKIQGEGMGSILLGGVGGASSYASLEDYAKTTGKANPLMRKAQGRGLEQLSGKLSDLSLQAPKKKKNNIKFDM